MKAKAVSLSRAKKTASAPRKKPTTATKNKKKKTPCVLLTVANLKGGVGKTTVVVNLAASLGLRGKRVLVVDLDFQGNATTGLGQTRSDDFSNVYRVLTKQTQISEAINSSEIPNVDILGSHRSLLDFAKSHNGTLGREYLFADWREDPSLSSYDMIIFDTHPDMDCLTLSALVASDYYLVPLFAELDPIVGLSDMFQQIETVKKRYNRGLSLAGVLVTKFDRSESTHRKLEEKIRQGTRRGNYSVFKTVIPISKRLSASKLMSRPVVISDPKASVAMAFKSLANEMVPRLKPKTGASKLEKVVDFSRIEKQVCLEAKVEAESESLI